MYKVYLPIGFFYALLKYVIQFSCDHLLLILKLTKFMKFFDIILIAHKAFN